MQKTSLRAMYPRGGSKVKRQGQRTGGEVACSTDCLASYLSNISNVSESLDNLQYWNLPNYGWELSNTKLKYMKTYSLKTGLLKGLKYFALFLLPVLVDKFVISYPEVAQLTVGGLLVVASNWLKIKFTS